MSYLMIFIGIVLFLLILSTLIVTLVHFFLAFFDICIGERYFPYKYTKGNNEPKFKVRYDIPAISYIFSIFPLALIMSIIDKYFSHSFDIYAYIIAASIYSIIMYLGMYRKTGRIDGGEYYRGLLKNHRQFLQLSFLPFVFFITVVGFVLATMDKIEGLPDWSLSSNSVSAFMDAIWEIPRDSSENHYFLESSSKLLLMLYIFSLPLQIISFFVNQISEYLFSNGQGYKRYLRKVWGGVVWIFNK
ncbi:hypothetical protein [Listeria booriae]|uniref:Uncharacterized protein n=1 Tax=Listeria booriae TaxID=1552123 RepID=A0A7X1DPK4_9LIST|nr:hypothetical protein [Listeria booriae]MBC1228072.1 hypothetical protein [Listeria booriae]MBC2370407.1 hypothetical protein [Listeria booriae]MBC2391430.1 hypothetical protein [Listeria booriae]